MSFQNVIENALFGKAEGLLEISDLHLAPHGRGNQYQSASVLHLYQQVKYFQKLEICHKILIMLDSRCSH